jgi:hypothetical protein
VLALDESIAIHEAAHGVAAVRVGLTLDQVTAAVEEWGLGGSAGLSLPADYSPSRYPDIARKQAVVALAGPIAEIRVALRIGVVLHRECVGGSGAFRAQRER